MRKLGFALAALTGLWMAAAGLVGAQDKGGDKIDAAKLVGLWLAEKGDFPPGSTIEF